MNRKIADLIYWIMIIVVISFCIFLYFYLTGEAKQCVADPLKYYEVGTNQMCYCMNGGGIFTVTP